MLASLTVGSIFMARTRHGAELILLTTAVDEHAIDARGINLFQEFRFDRRTGDSDLSSEELFFCRVVSTKPLPTHIRDDLIELDRRNHSENPEDHGPLTGDERRALVHMASHYSDQRLKEPSAREDRASLIGRLQVGDIFFAEPSPRISGVSSTAIRDCLVTGVNARSIDARSIGPGEELQFDRRSGIQVGSDEDLMWVISSVEPLPADLHAIKMAHERRYRLLETSERLRLTEEEMACSGFSYLFYVGHPLPALSQPDLEKAGLITEDRQP